MRDFRAAIAEGAQRLKRPFKLSGAIGSAQPAQGAFPVRRVTRHPTYRATFAGRSGKVAEATQEIIKKPSPMRRALDALERAL